MKQQQIYTPTLMTMDRKALRVVIVGGSIAGLSLAHCLARADIDYVVLEKRCELAPQEGASIGIMPNGARILQQLGLYDALEELVHPLEEAHVTYPDGFHYSSQYPRLLCERFGYPLAFLDRQQVLALLADTLPHQDRIHTNTTVVRVDDQGGDLPLRVHCRDGSIYEGDLVVGADGVHSVVRGEMWHRAGISAHQEQQRTPFFVSLRITELTYERPRYASAIRLHLRHLLSCAQYTCRTADHRLQPRAEYPERGRQTWAHILVSFPPPAA